MPLNQPVLSGIVGVDLSIQALSDEVAALVPRRRIGASPERALSGLIKGARAGAVIRLEPGFYEFKSGLDIDTDDITLIADGRVRFRGSGTVVTLTGERCALVGIEIETTSDDPAVAVVGSHCSLDRCRLTGPASQGVNVDADYCAIRNCSFMDDATHAGLADNDIYYEDRAAYGIVSGNKWSSTREYVLSYKTGDNMSEAANGPATIIDVRP